MSEVLPDCEVTDLAKDAFKHQQIAAVLRDLIVSCPQPFSIGLFGKWGTGKSTIVKFLISEIRKPNTIGVVAFDVWKFSGDSLRRALLIQAELQLREQGFIPSSFRIDRRVSENTLETRSSIRIDWAKLAQITLYGILISVIVTAILKGFESGADFITALGFSSALSLAIGFINSVTNIFRFESEALPGIWT